MSVTVLPLTEADLPEAQHIMRRAFGTFMGAPDLDTFWTDFDYVYGRFGAEHVASFAAQLDGEPVGSNFATRWGASGFSGRSRRVPICGTAASPSRWSRPSATPLTSGASAMPGFAPFLRVQSTSGCIRNLVSTRAI